MKMTDLFLSELDREAERSTRVLRNFPEGQSDWKPHESSLTIGYIAQMVAMIPGWVVFAITQNELDLDPPSGQRMSMPPMKTAADFLGAHEKAVAGAREALQKTSDDFLLTPWRLLVKAQVVQEHPRHIIIRDLINHLVHHRGQLTVYYRLLGVKVPALYGPSADDKRF